jgi:hypothetical protein
MTIPGLIAPAAGLASSQWKIVQLASTAGEVKLGTSATSKVIGVLVEPGGASAPVTVQYGGIVEVLAETSVAIGDLVGCSSTGRAKTVSGANNQILGKALTASANAGDRITVLLSLSNL